MRELKIGSRGDQHATGFTVFWSDCTENWYSNSMSGFSARVQLEE